MAALAVLALVGASHFTEASSLAGTAIAVTYDGKTNFKASKARAKLPLTVELTALGKGLDGVYLQKLEAEVIADPWPCMGRAKPPGWLGEIDTSAWTFEPTKVELGEPLKLVVPVNLNTTCKGYDAVLVFRLTFREDRPITDDTLLRARLDVSVRVK